MPLDLLKILPSCLVNLDTTGNMALYLQMFSEVYEEMKADNESVLTVQDLDRAPTWCLLYIARSLGAEILRLNELENPNMDLDSNGDGIADNWTTSGSVVGSLTLRRKSSTQKLTMGNTAKFHQSLTLTAVPYVLEAKIRVTSGSVRFGDTSDNSKTILVTAAISDDAYATYSLMITPTAGARNYGLVATAANTVVYIDSVRVDQNAKQAMMRVWLRNAVTEYKRKGGLEGISSLVSLFTGETVSSFVEQKSDKHSLLYNRRGCEYLYFGELGAPDPALGPPANPALYSREWNSLQGTSDLNTIYMDFGALVNGSFDQSLSGWTVSAGAGVLGFERKYSGAGSLKLTGSSIVMYQDPVTVAINKRWVLTAWVWIPYAAAWSFSQMPRLVVRAAGGGAAIVTGTAASASMNDKWQQIRVVLPSTNAVASLRVEIQATATSGAGHFYTDSWWFLKNKWLLVNVTDPGVSLRAEMKNLLEALLLNYVPIGVEVEVAFV